MSALAGRAFHTTSSTAAATRPPAAANMARRRSRCRLRRFLRCSRRMSVLCTMAAALLFQATVYLSFVSDLFQDCFHGQKTEFFVLRAHFCDKMNKFFILFLGEKAKTPPFRGFYHKKGGFLSKDVEDFTFPNIDIFGK